MTIIQHHDALIGAFDSLGTEDFDSACKETVQRFKAIGLSPERNNLAVDLGCGRGTQSIALARLGFHVLAIDSCPALLAELKMNATREALPVSGIESDLVEHLKTVRGAPGVITCLGDTLVRLESFQAVSEMIHLASRRIARGGTLVLGFRDHFSRMKRGDQVEIPVRRRDGQYVTRRIEGLADSVQVVDEFVEKREGRWVNRARSYEQLRLKPGRIASELRKAGLKIVRKENRAGLVTISATKPFPVQVQGWLTTLTSNWRIAS